MASSSSHLSDDDFYNDGYHEMTEQEEEEYDRAYKESQGFDVPSFDNIYGFGLIFPMSEENISSKLPQLRLYAEEAIKHYNNQNGTNFEFVKILKANRQAACGLLYYITFEVKPIGTTTEFPTTTFQARVLSGIPPPRIVVELCRPKPSN